MHDRLQRAVWLLALGVMACAEPLAGGPVYGPDAAPQDTAASDAAEIAEDVPTDPCTGKSCAGGQVCDPSTGQCVACNLAADCAEAGSKCVDHVCKPATACTTDKQCQATAEICDKAAGYCVACLNDTDCDAGVACVKRRCVPAPSSCNTDADCAPVGWRCTSSGTCAACAKDAHCPASAFCDQGLCFPDVCMQGQAKCLDPLTVATCKANGGGWIAKPCGAGQACEAAQCASDDCSPGTGKCGAGKAWTCKPNGVGWTAKACGDKQVCAVVGTVASCKDVLCPAGKLYCAGDKAMQCSDDGIAQSLVADCAKPGPDGKAQVCKAGKCGPVTCTPGQSTCHDETTMATCKADGQTVETTACVGDTPACLGGQCVACKPGSNFCAKAAPGKASTVVMKCNATGTDGEIDSVCSDDKICIQGACAKPSLCIPGSLYCGPAGSNGKATLVMKCNSAGSDGDIHKVCDPGTTCTDGKCLGKKICNEGEKLCDGLATVLTCSNFGTQWSATACATGSSCIKGICQPGIICAAKKVFCAGTVLKLCAANGKSSETGMDCASEKKTCVDGVCIDQACPTKPGVPSCGDGCCAISEDTDSCPKDCPCSGGKKLLTATQWCDDSGSKPGWRDQPGICVDGHRNGWFDKLPCPFDVAIANDAKWTGPCSGCLEKKIITDGAGLKIAAWKDDAKVYHCCKGKDLLRINR